MNLKYTSKSNVFLKLYFYWAVKNNIIKTAINIFGKNKFDCKKHFGLR